MSQPPNIPATVTELGRKLLLSIWRAQEKRGACDWTAQQWAEKYGVARKTVQRALTSMGAAGYVRTLTNRGSKNPVRIVVPSALAAGFADLERQMSSWDKGGTRAELIVPSASHESPMKVPAKSHESPITTVDIDARALSRHASKPSRGGETATAPEPFHLDEEPEHVGRPPVPDIWQLPGDLFKQAGDALAFLKRRRKDLFRHRGIGGHAMRLARFAMAREPAERWYTAVAMMRLPPERPDPALLATIRDIAEHTGEYESPEGIKPDPITVQSFRAICDAPEDVREACIEAFGGDIHTAALNPPEVLRHWVREHTPKYDPGDAHRAALDAVANAPIPAHLADLFAE